MSPSHSLEVDARKLLWTRTVSLVTSGCFLMGTWPCVSDPHQQLHREPEFWVDMEIQHISTPPHRERQLAPYILLPDLSGPGTPPASLGVSLGSELGKVLWCGAVCDNSWAVLHSAPQQGRLALCATLLWLHRPPWGFWLLWISFFSSHLRDSRKRKMCLVYFSCCLCSTFQACQCGKILKCWICMKIETPNPSILKCTLVQLIRIESFSSLLAEYCVGVVLSTALSFPQTSSF